MAVASIRTLYASFCPAGLVSALLHTMYANREPYEAVTAPQLVLQHPR